MAASLEKFFQLKKHHTSVKTEFVAGITNFMAMSYILAVQPSIMASAGMPVGSVATAVALVSGIASIFMGLYSKYPFVLAPGMGANIFFSFTLVASGIFTWQQGISLVLFSGILFLLMTIFGFREAVAHFLPASIKLGIGAVIGIFLIYLGLKNSGIIIPTTQGLSMAKLNTPNIMLTLGGLLLTIALQLRKIPGSMLIGIISITLAGIPLGITQLPDNFFSLPPSLEPVTFKFDFSGLITPSTLPFIFVFFIGDFFDTLGTLLGVASQAKMLDKNGNLPNIEKPFFVDAVSTVLGSCFGLTTVTTYVESASGVSVGGRTGLTSIFTGLCFFGALLFTPLILMVPNIATAPCLIIVGLMLLDSLSHINFGTLDDTIAPLSMMAITAFSGSIANGIAVGLILYTFIKIVLGKTKELSPGLYLLTAVFIYYLAQQ